MRTHQEPVEHVREGWVFLSKGGTRQVVRAVHRDPDRPGYWMIDSRVGEAGALFRIPDGHYVQVVSPSRKDVTRAYLRAVE